MNLKHTAFAAAALAVVAASSPARAQVYQVADGQDDIWLRAGPGQNYVKLVYMPPRSIVQQTGPCRNATDVDSRFAFCPGFVYDQYGRVVSGYFSESAKYSPQPR